MANTTPLRGAKAIFLSLIQLAQRCFIRLDLLGQCLALKLHIVDTNAILGFKQGSILLVERFKRSVRHHHLRREGGQRDTHHRDVPLLLG